MRMRSVAVFGVLLTVGVMASFAPSAKATRDYYATYYDVEWTSTGTTQPHIGRGHLIGVAAQSGSVVTFTIDLIARTEEPFPGAWGGDVTTFGDGSWRFTLPHDAPYDGGHIASGVLIDTGNTGVYHVHCLKVAPAVIQCMPEGVSWGITGVDPFTVGNYDALRISGSYLR